MISTLKLLKVINKNTSFFLQFPFPLLLSYRAHTYTLKDAQTKKTTRQSNTGTRIRGKVKKKKMKAVVFKTSKKVVGCFPFSCLFFPRNYFFFIHLREESHRAAVWLDRRCFCFTDSSRTLEILC